MSRRAEWLAVAGCIGIWIIAIERFRGASALDVFAASGAPVDVAERAQVLHDAAKIGRYGAFRPVAGWSTPSTDTAVGVRPIVFERPPLYLKGVMGGPPWLAVLSSYDAGGEDKVLRAGDSLGVVELRAIRADGVTVRFRDSTWIIPLLEPERP